MSRTLGPKLGPLSNREADFRAQSILVVGKDGRLQFAPFIRHGPRVPTEILAEIFVHCLPGDDFVSPDLATAPLVLCGICRRWREVAISTPRLWSSLFIDFDLRAAYETGLYETWLSRAGDTPLSLSLPLQEDRSVDAGLVDSLLKSIVGLSRQWQQIEINIGDAWARFISPAEMRFPSLEKLDIFVVLDNLSISFCEAPKLREVTIGRHSPRLQLPWSQLTKLRCDNVPIPSLLGILRDCSNLLDGNSQVDVDPSALPLSVLHHSCLQRLELGPVYQNSVMTRNVMPVLDCLKIHGLQSLTLKFPFYFTIPTTDMSPFLSFISRSSCQLHALILAGVPTTSDALIECLKATPSLVHLKLTFRPNHFLVDANTVFTHFSGPADFLPKLVSFYTVFPYAYETSRLPSASAVVQMLCSRCGAVGSTRLQSFRLGHFNIDLEFDEPITLHTEFQRLQAEGMDLYVGQTAQFALFRDPSFRPLV
ncbi:hypothetical protein DFH06DRAFT_48335 [Mycena polygramma]|nr:hypothetical protein DFH06DRAFT_48335 [Mycena polygramma]